MKIFRTQSEPRLLEILEAQKADRTTWRAQVYQIAALKKAGVTTGIENILLGIIVNHLAEKEGFAFLCHNGDVILLGHALFKRHFDLIEQELTQHIPPEVLGKLAAPLVSTYDLSVHWSIFYQLAEKKRDAYQLHQKVSSTTAKTAIPTKPGTGLSQEAYQRLLAKGLAERKIRKRACILLIEDDPLSLHMAKKAIEKNFTIQVATNAAEARTAYMTHVPDVVFMDIGLPDSNGHILLAELIALDPDAFIVMLSGNSFQADIIKAMRTGAKGFVGKPFSRAKLLHYISQSSHCSHYLSPNDLL